MCSVCLYLCSVDLPGESQIVMPSAIPHSAAADDEIEFLGTVTCSDADSPQVQRRAPARKRKPCVLQNEDEEEESKLF